VNFFSFPLSLRPPSAAIVLLLTIFPFLRAASPVFRRLVSFGDFDIFEMKGGIPLPHVYPLCSPLPSFSYPLYPRSGADLLVS